MGGDSITETHISTLTDSIILLRYVEMFSEMKRGLPVLKMRGSAHDKAIRAFTIDKGGMRMGRPFRNVTGILAGAPVQSLAERRGARVDEGGCRIRRGGTTTAVTSSGRRMLS